MFIEARKATLQFAWGQRDSLANVAAELFRAIRKGPTRILVFGAGGVEKIRLVIFSPVS